MEMKEKGFCHVERDVDENTNDYEPVSFRRVILVVRVQHPGSVVANADAATDNAGRGLTPWRHQSSPAHSFYRRLEGHSDAGYY